MEVLRIFLGVLALFFAFQLGRIAMQLRRAGLPYTKALTWMLRTLVCLFAIVWVGGFDATAIVFLALAAAAVAGGAYVVSRPAPSDEVHLFNDERK